MSYFVEFLDLVVWFFTEGIFDFFKELMEFLLTWMTLAWLKMKLFTLQISWAVAKIVLQEINITQYLTQAFSILPAGARATLDYFNITTGIGYMVQALATRFVLRISGGLL